MSGEMVAMSGATRLHERLLANLAGMLYVALRGKPCEPHGGNLRVRVRQTNYLYPDFTVICGEPEMLDDTYLDTILNPTVIFEILSQTTEHRDIGIKWRLYQQIESLKHYVIIYQDTARVEVHSRQSATQWLEQVVLGLGGTAELPAIAVNLPLGDLYERVPIEPDSASL